MSHTPGPWRAPFPSYVLAAHPGGKVCQLVGVYVDNPNAEADARLIAAAPTMLAALLQLAEEHEEQAEAERSLWGDLADPLEVEGHERLAKIARDAVNAATGGAQ